MRRLIVTLAVVAIVVGLVPAVAGAEPGDYDSTYGTCGVVMPSGFDEAGLAVVGTALDDNGTTVELHDDDLASAPQLFRYRADQRLDRGYGTNGALTLPVHTGGHASTMRRAPGHRVVVASRSSVPGTIRIMRVTAAGALDATFNWTGWSDVPGDSPSDLAVWPDGSIILVDATSDLTRVLPNGAVDPTFDRAPVRSLINATSVSAIGEHDAIVSGPLAFTSPDGRVTGSARIDGTGAVDTGFALADTYAGHIIREGSREVVSDSQDRLIVLEQLDDADGGYVVSRHFGDGTLDPTYGTAGALFVTGNRGAGMLRLGPDDSVALLELRWYPGGTGFVPVTRMVTAAGTFDRGYGFVGASGLFIGTSVGANGFDRSGKLLQAWGLDPGERMVRYRVRLDRLKAGAGLVLQWNGVGWPTRFGGDPAPECPFDAPYWDQTDRARGITAVTGRGGYEVDAFGNIARFDIGQQRRRPPAATGNARWPGWDIARGIAAKPDGTGGYTLDAFGGLHPFRTGTSPMPPATMKGPYWSGWDITRGVALMPAGDKGYVLDGFGGIHPFTTPGHAMPPAVHSSGYWPGWDIARGIGILPDGTGGYVVDGFGGFHPFSIGNHAPPPKPGPGAPYVAGVDWVRGYTFVQPMRTTATGTSAPSGTPMTMADPPTLRPRSITAAP